VKKTFLWIEVARLIFYDELVDVVDELPECDLAITFEILDDELELLDWTLVMLSTKYKEN